MKKKSLIEFLHEIEKIDFLVRNQTKANGDGGEGGKSIFSLPHTPQ